MNYIVIDLEWNQSSSGPAGENARLQFEVIEIGATKLDSILLTNTEASLNHAFIDDYNPQFVNYSIMMNHFYEQEDLLMLYSANLRNGVVKKNTYSVPGDLWILPIYNRIWISTI